MPLYVYKCAKCGHLYEKIEKFDAPARQKCPRCKGRAERQLAPPAIQFKGSGWYVTDYARSGAATEKKETTGTSETKEGKEVKTEKPKKEKKAAKDK